MKGETDGLRKNSYLNLLSSKNTRREPAYQTYYRLFKDNLQDELYNDYLAYKKKSEGETDDAPDALARSPTPTADISTQSAAQRKSDTNCFVAFRNSWLAKKLQAESDATKEHVEKSRRDAGENAHLSHAGASEVVNAESEATRIKNARTMQV